MKFRKLLSRVLMWADSRHSETHPLAASGNRRALPWRAWDWLACSQRGAAAGAKNRFRQNPGLSRKFAFQAKPRDVRSSFSGPLSA